MHVFRSLSDIPAEFGPSAVTIGKFDGVHLGHRAVIERLRSVAAARALASVVVTFDRHPHALLRPGHLPEPLVSNEQKLELLASLDPDAALMLTFDAALSHESAEEFVSSVLVDALQAKAVLVGADFRFGDGGAGTVDVLTELGRHHGFDVLVVEDVSPAGTRVSSSGIRSLLAEGRVAEAAELLGELPTVRGTVVTGQQRGRAMGYPTANLSPHPEGFVPADGVYAAWLTVGGVRYAAAVSIGNNPTFDGVPDKQVEAHAIDQVLDLYGQVAEISFVEYVRGMRKFAGPDELATEMRADEDRIRVILGVAPKPTP
jgi:riboflavin kinase/FMN adenylyltransferase